jgi:amicoumacin kinase
MDPNHLPVADSAPYHDALAQCVHDWGLAPEKTTMLRDGVNHVFATQSKSGEPVIVRISDGVKRSRSELDGELIWLDHLIRHGCTVSTPIRSQRGELLETVDLNAGPYHVCCFKRFGGRELHPRTDPDWTDELFLKLGREIGRIHRVSDELRLPPGQDRKPWYECDFSQIPDPLPKGFNPWLREPMQAFTAEMRTRPQKPRHYGLVHRDLHSGNFLVERGQVQIIDFDLGCYGWRAMDFSVLLFAHYYFPSSRVPHASPELAGHVLATLVRGYRDEYTIDLDQLEMVGDLLKLREILFYIVSAPAQQHWQIAMGDPHPTVTESLAWIEKLWLDDIDLRVDLSQL